MNNEQLKKLVLSKYTWEPWLERPFFAFMLSTFEGGNSKRAFKRIGLIDWECKTFLFTNHTWYEADEVFKMTQPIVETFLQKHSLADVNNLIDKWFAQRKRVLIEISKKPNISVNKKLEIIAEILSEATTFIWVSHLLEYVLIPTLKQETAKYIKTDLDRFISEASVPIKKTALERMEEEMRRGGVDFKVLAREYGWMRARDGFARPYTSQELLDYAKGLKPRVPHKYPAIPAPLQRLYEQARELIYFRTHRTDIYCELLFLARPIFRACCKKLKIPFLQLKFYSLPSLIAGQPTKYGKDVSVIGYGDQMFFYNYSIINKQERVIVPEVKGMVAQRGKVQGLAKIVMHVAELGKVKAGDIMITYMTSPNFLPAMKLAAGFVTNEGGLTCHAAIVAREMKKPCVIGTKIATKVFKDGDLVEVDANKGIVRKLSGI